MHARRSLVALALSGLCLVACQQDQPGKNAAPTSSALAPAAPQSDMSKTFAVEADPSKVSFLMDAPIEKIYGEAPGAVSGEIFVDLMDVTKTTGLVKVDLDKLAIYQQKRENENASFTERTKVEKQNEHARDWLEIGKDVSADKKEKNRYIEFKLKKVETDGPKDITKMTGAERKISLKVTGDFRLHERTVEKTTELEVTFKFDGDKPSAVAIKTVKPFAVNLEQHDVRPRDALGAILQKTTEELSILGKKVAKDAMIDVDFSAKVK
jgi:hypothetical protein